jgi:hypothetical protein
MILQETGGLVYQKTVINVFIILRSRTELKINGRYELQRKGLFQRLKVFSLERTE